MIAVLDQSLGSILMLRRHRFITGQWVWEIPGGYANDTADGAAAAAREALEEPGGLRATSGSC
jgi:8-oxo-dGTP pyrophosphatase MutT (NUDIX family)